MAVRRRASRIGIELDGHLPQHLAPQSLTYARHFARRIGRAFQAGQSNFYTGIGVGFLVIRHSEVLVCSSKTFLQSGLKRVSDAPFGGIDSGNPLLCALVS